MLAIFNFNDFKETVANITSKLRMVANDCLNNVSLNLNRNINCKV